MSLDIAREEVVQALCAHYAQDHLSTGELEARFERVYRAGSRRELDTLLEGLPALRGTAPAPAPLYQVAATAGGGPLLPGEKRYLALFSEVKKEGQWAPSPLIRAKVLFGSMTLDLREAEIPADGIHVDIDVIFGDCKILLPPGVGADVDATAVLGDVKDKAHRALPGAPVLRVRGGVVFGDISVVTKLPKPVRMEGWRDQVRRLLGGDGGPRGS